MLSASRAPCNWASGPFWKGIWAVHLCACYVLWAALHTAPGRSTPHSI